MSKGILLVLGVGTLYTSGMVILSRNAVSSVIYLVGTIVNGGLILMMLGVSLIPLVYVIVYVGGIAILFLFVIMMVDLNKGREGKRMERRSEVRVSGWLVVVLTGVLYKNEMRGGVGIITGYREMR